MRGRQAPACSEPPILICHRTMTPGPASQGRGRAGPAGLRLPACRSQVCTEGPPSFLAEPSWLSPNSQDAKATGTVLSAGSPPAGEGRGPGAGNCREAAPWTCYALGTAAGPGASGRCPAQGQGELSLWSAGTRLGFRPPGPRQPLGEPRVGPVGTGSPRQYFSGPECAGEPQAALLPGLAQQGQPRRCCSRERVRACDLGSAPSPSVSAL